MILVDSEYFRYKGSNCYCSPATASRIRRSISRKPLNAIHLLGSGNYHYLSLFWLEKIEEDFSLLLFDNHSDREDGAFSKNTLSCGSWVRNALELPHLKNLKWIRTFPPTGGALDIYRGIETHVYISIDLDVLSPRYAKTNWDQGTMSIDELTTILQDCPLRIIGVDLCGAENDNDGMFAESVAKENKDSIRAIISSLKDK